jgi:recombination associated protein RdgC
MSTNPFKAFVPFVVNSAAYDSDADHLQVTDPSGGDWRRIGLAEPIKGEGFAVKLQGRDLICAVQINERILPGKVRDEALVKLVAKTEKLDGRKVSKKEYAQLREQVEFELLPKAFIRRTVVPVIFTKLDEHRDFMLICTSSAKRADDCAAVMLALYGDALKASALQVNAPLPGQFRTLALGESWGIDGMLADFGPTDSIVLKGSDKKRISIKDKPIDERDVQDIVSLAEYNVVEMGMAYGDEWDTAPVLTFTVNESLIFKRIETPGIKTTGKDYDLHAHATYVSMEYRKMLIDFIEACGGLAGASTSGSDEDDEL